MEKLLFGKKIRCVDNFLSISDLQNAYKEIKILYNLSDRNFYDITNTNKFLKSIYDLIFANDDYNSPILINENYSYSDFKIECDTYGSTKVLKRLGVYKTVGARHTRNTMCEERIWKFIYINLFNEHSSINIPDWIKDINIDVYRFSIKRAESLELNFINQLIPKIELFLESEPKTQYKLDNYIYDLYLKILDKQILIEYNEKHHNFTPEKDFEKAKYAYDNEFYIIHIPQGKEDDIKIYLNEIVKGKLTLDDCFELCEIRFNECCEYDCDKEINKKLFGIECESSRLSASLSDLRKIIKMRDFIKNALHLKFIKNNNQIINTIKNLYIC